MRPEKLVIGPERDFIVQRCDEFKVAPTLSAERGAFANVSPESLVHKFVLADDRLPNHRLPAVSAGGDVRSPVMPCMRSAGIAAVVAVGLDPRHADDIDNAPVGEQPARAAANSVAGLGRPNHKGAQAPVSDVGAFFMPAVRRRVRILPVCGGRRGDTARCAGSFVPVDQPRAVRHLVWSRGAGLHSQRSSPCPISFRSPPHAHSSGVFFPRFKAMSTRPGRTLTKQRASSPTSSCSASTRCAREVCHAD